MITAKEPLLSGKCVLITGGTTPIGTACATLLAYHQALVLIGGEDQKVLDDTLELIRHQVPGCSVTGYVADLTTNKGVEAFFLHARIAFPGIATVVINPLTNWDSARGAYNTCLHKAADIMRYRKSGDIIIVNDDATKNGSFVTEVDAFRHEIDGSGINLSLIESADWASAAADKAEAVLGKLAAN